MSLTKMRRCPFCGGEATIKNCSEFKTDYADYRVYCKECGASTEQNLLTRDEAVDRWNTRFFDKDVAMQVVELLVGRYSLDRVKVTEE